MKISDAKVDAKHHAKDHANRLSNLVCIAQPGDQQRAGRGPAPSVELKGIGVPDPSMKRSAKSNETRPKQPAVIATVTANA